MLSGFFSTGLGFVIVVCPVGCRTDARSETSVAMHMSRDVDFVVLIPLVCSLVERLR